MAKINLNTLLANQPNKELVDFGVRVYSALVENFPQTFFVGGMVRDMLLGKEILDIDIATEAKPEQVTNILKKYFIETNIGYGNLGVVLATEQNYTVSITAFRKDLDSEDRYPKIKFVKTYKEDSKRRDFTINSLYLRLKTQEILDPYKGFKDIKQKRVRFIGKASQRIQQDPLRILRALRFALNLNFKIEKNTYKAIKHNFNLISTLTKSRIQKELNKIINKKNNKILQEVINNPKLLDKYFK